MEVIVGFLLVYTLVREVFFIYSQQKLLNRLMSRNYYDLKVSELVGKPDDKPKIFADEGEPEDLAVLNGIGTI